MSFSDFEYSDKRKQTRRDGSGRALEWFAEADRTVFSAGWRWSQTLSLGNHAAHSPAQNWFSLSDPAMEEALYDITSMRQFTRLTLSGPTPEDTTIMNFRHLLESISWPLRSCGVFNSPRGCGKLLGASLESVSWRVAGRARFPLLDIDMQISPSSAYPRKGSRGPFFVSV